MKATNKRITCASISERVDGLEARMNEAARFSKSLDARLSAVEATMGLTAPVETGKGTGKGKKAPTKKPEAKKSEAPKRGNGRSRKVYIYHGAKWFVDAEKFNEADYFSYAKKMGWTYKNAEGKLCVNSDRRVDVYAHFGWLVKAC